VDARATGAAVAVAVVSWNTRDLLAECLRSLEPEADAGRAEVWVVDNASSDGSAELVREQFGWVTLVASEENLGFGRAVNLVARRTTTPWIAPANADIALEPGALTALLDTGGHHSDAGAVAPALLLPNGRIQHSVHPFPTLPFTLLFNLGIPRLSRRLGDRLTLEGAWDETRPRVVDWAMGAFLIVRRDAFESIGGFDEAHWMYAEDLDLGWRLRRARWTTRYEPAAIVRHEGSAAAEQAFGDDQVNRWMRASYSWMARRRGVVRTWTCAALNCAGAAARLAFNSPAARIRPDRFGPLRDENRIWLRAHRTGLQSAHALRAERF
jgi:N-acetylglucosaminyl-diphospho-decaprenol L-rhamnosyltransferase